MSIKKILFSTTAFLFIFIISAFSAVPDSISIKKIDSLNTKIVSNKLATNDTLKNDSTKKIEPIDTIPPSLPIMKYGSMFLLPHHFYQKIKKDDNNYLNAYSFSDIFKAQHRYYPLSLGMYGLFNNMSVLGGSSRDNNFRFNGRTLTDFEFGSFNPELFSPDFVESAEIMVGSDAVILGDAASGALINFQEIRYNTKNPYTHLFYCDGGFGYFGSDGIFSQNFLKNWNLTLGFRRQSDHGYFDNSGLDSWNFRSIIRWNPSNLTNISFTQNYFNNINGLSGGTSTYTSSMTNLNSSVLSENMNERVFRYDATMQLCSYITSDTSQAFSMNTYFSNIEWWRYYDLKLLNDTSALGRIKNFNSYTGISGKYEFSAFRAIIIRTGGEINYIKIGGSPFYSAWKGISSSVWGYGQLDFIPQFEITGGYRMNLLYSKVANSLGGSIKYNFSNKAHILADLSISEKIPSLVEGIALSKERNQLAFFEFEYNFDELNTSLRFFDRNVQNPILSDSTPMSSNNIFGIRTYNGDSRNILGVGFNVEYRHNLKYNLFNVFTLESYSIEPWGQFQNSLTNGTDDKRIPLFYGGVKAFLTFLASESIMNIGLELSALSSQQGNQFISITRQMIPNQSSNSAATDGLNLFVSLKLGDAYLRLTWMNILNSKYYYIPFYTEMNSNFRMSVSWSFFD
ncbi:MAG: hypothetical protein NT007_09115 [Candidatus Kapabacteria bacterium]|nr:hypothetical protein [Candidatus Kapabacteria bacterium]